MQKMPRRQFMSSAAAAATTIVPRHVLGGRGRPAPSDKLNLAAVGIGGMGAVDIEDLATESIVALCDVDWDYAAKTFNKYPRARRYKDYRVMLEREKEIDGVIVATPDHLHAVISMAAIRAGKHVYTEKPMAYCVDEVRQLAAAARMAKVATQMGNQGHASDTIRLLCEWIWDGAIGPVREVHAWTPHPVWPQGLQRPTETPVIPASLDWDLWLGPAAARPYHPAYLPGKWRGWWDFGTGGLGDMGCHVLDHVFWALKLGPPESIEARCSIFVAKAMTWDRELNTESYPQASIVYYRFPARGQMPPVKVVWYDGGLMPERPDELEPGRTMGDQYGGAIYIGDKGKIITGSHGANGLRLIPESRMKDYPRPPKLLPRSVGHRQEWVAACKGGPPAGSSFPDYAGQLTEMVLLGNVALRMAGTKLLWDADKMEFRNAPEANQYLRRPYRTGWSL